MQTILTDLDLPLVPGSTKGVMKEIGASSTDLWKVELKDLRLIPNFNVRIKDAAYKTHIRSLADSMKVDGFKQSKPISDLCAQTQGVSVK